MAKANTPKRNIEAITADSFDALSKWLRKIPQIEFYEWEKNPDTGYLQIKSQRTVKEVATEFEKAMEQNGISFEYLSTMGNDPMYGYKDQNVMGELWPRRSETTVRLETGGNEGYSLYVCVTVRTRSEDKRFDRIEKYEPIRVKILSSWAGALAAHAFAFHVLGC